MPENASAKADPTETKRKAHTCNATTNKPVSDLLLSKALFTQIESEGVAAYPNECCGILVGRDVTIEGITRRIVDRLEPGRTISRLPSSTIVFPSTPPSN